MIGVGGKKYLFGIYLMYNVFVSAEIIKMLVFIFC